MGIIEILKEQATISFTGRINILDNESGQFLGVILIRDGAIVNCHYEKSTGRRILYKLVHDDIISNYSFKYLVEPEIISDEQTGFDIQYSEFYKLITSYISNVSESSKLRPPDELKLMVNSSLFEEDKNLDAGEFELICAIIDHSKVKDIYRECYLYEHEITHALVSLRKKGLLKVIS
jgi:hypothetical protein